MHGCYYNLVRAYVDVRKESAVHICALCGIVVIVAVLLQSLHQLLHVLFCRGLGGEKKDCCFFLAANTPVFKRNTLLAQIIHHFIRQHKELLIRGRIYRYAVALHHKSLADSLRQCHSMLTNTLIQIIFSKIYTQKLPIWHLVIILVYILYYCE